MTSVYSQSLFQQSAAQGGVSAAQVRMSKERSLAHLHAQEKQRKYQLDSHADNCQRKIDATADLDLTALETETFQLIEQQRTALSQQLEQMEMLTEYGAAESVLNVEYTALSLNLHAKIASLERKKKKLLDSANLPASLDWEVIAPVGPVHMALQQATLQSQHARMTARQ